MELKLSINKTPEQNAEIYFERAKKFKKKIPGIKKIVESYKAKLSDAEALQSQPMVVKEPKRKPEWFEKFRWFISSDNHLVIGGRDATTNEIVIKKYTTPNDLVFHTELPGSPFVVIKNINNTNGNDATNLEKVPQQTILEAAEFCASFSKSWKAGRSSAEVFHVNPDQVSKEAKSGEYISKGAFMIYGKRTFHNVNLNLAICNIGKIMTGPLSAVKKQCEDKELKYVMITQGSDKLSDTGKKIQKIIGGELDEIVRNLPSECTIKK
jgi:predicted ribosome quality control (RQC) complex YloA/Tae2 family protein